MKALFRFGVVVLALSLAIWVVVTRAQFEPKSHLTPSLVADTTAIEPGKPFTVGILLKIDPDWHTYWRSAGEIGLPLEVNWNLPAGFQASDLEWPLPHTLMDGDFLNYVYEKEAMVMATITPPAKLPSGGIALKAKVSWQVCSETNPVKKMIGTCIQGSADLALPLAGGSPATPANEALFARWRAELPKTTAPPAVSWELSDRKKVSLTIQGLAAGQKPVFFVLPPAGATPGHPTLSEPDASGARTISFPVDPPAPAGAVWRGLLVVEKGEAREGWYIASDTPAGAVAAAPPSSAPGAAAPVALSGGSTPPATLQNPPTLASALLFAFLGGLILNIMPCVLPVIALKIFGFVKQAGEEPRRVFRLGLAFVAGVFTFFIALAVIAIVLHASGRNLSWGSQFQNPYFLAGIIALIFVFGLNLLGVFEITLSGGATSTLSELSSREGYGGAFLHGVFTTLLGTSCTAPFLAISLGFALTQSAPVIFLLFVTVAAGMSLPYFLLTAVPAWMKYLPKPGVWMERFKQITGFIMMAVVVWLFSVMAESRPNAAVHLSWYLFALAVACWAMGVYQYRLTRWVVFPLIAIAGYFVLLQGPLAEASQTTASNLNGRIEAARKTGQPVFVDFTAAWCANCKTFEKLVLHSQEVQSAFEQKKVITVIADWTNPDPEIEEWLKRFGRAGVPLYLLYRPGETQPVVMDTLSTGNLLAELGKSGGGR
jgi:thiol:disulfide interchange protein/DsbC/DsbD-like thiol-disulfide interchange protein